MRTSVKTWAQWRDEYALSHQHPVNRRLHKICVPLILWSLLGFFDGLPAPWNAGLGGILAAGSLVFYARLGFRPLVLMVMTLSLCLLSYRFLETHGVPLLALTLPIFGVAWVGQFIGHALEGRRPSFFQDLQFLLIGPLWVLPSHWLESPSRQTPSSLD